MLRNKPLFRKGSWSIESVGVYFNQDSVPIDGLEIRHTSNKCRALGEKQKKDHNPWYLYNDSVENNGRCQRCGAKVPKGILAIKKLYEYGAENGATF